MTENNKQIVAPKYEPTSFEQEMSQLLTPIMLAFLLNALIQRGKS
jgi:hypothetical protein